MIWSDAPLSDLGLVECAHAMRRVSLGCSGMVGHKPTGAFGAELSEAPTSVLRLASQAGNAAWREEAPLLWLTPMATPRSTRVCPEFAVSVPRPTGKVPSLASCSFARSG